MGARSSKQKADITTPTKDKSKLKRKKSKKDAINGNTGVEEVSIQEKKDDAEIIKVEDSKAQETEASKKGETDSTGSENAPTAIVEDSPDKEHQKVAQLSDVQSPSEPSTSPVESEKPEVVSETAKETSSESGVKPEENIKSLPEVFSATEVKAEPAVEAKTEPELLAEIKVEPVVEEKAPEPAVEKKAPEPAVEEKVPEPSVEEKVPKPSVEEKVPEPTVEEKAPEPAVEEKAPEPAVEEKAPKPAVEEKAPEPAVEEKAPEPAVEEKAPEPAVEEKVPEPAVEEKVPEPAVEEKVPEPPVEEKVPEPAVEQITEPETKVEEQITEVVQNTELPKVETLSVTEESNVVKLEVPSEVEAVVSATTETKIESPKDFNSQPVEEIKPIAAQSEPVVSIPDVIGDSKDHQLLAQDVSNTVLSENAQSISASEVVKEVNEETKQLATDSLQELSQNNDLIDNKSNLNSNVIETKVEISPQSPVDVHPGETDRLNGHTEEHQVNGIESENQNGIIQMNGEVIGNGPSDAATLISWKNGGQEVAVCGDFCDWIDNCSLVENDGVFSTKIKLAKGKHHIKFLVDGNWTVDNSAPIIELEGHGQVNVLVVAEGSD